MPACGTEGLGTETRSAEIGSRCRIKLFENNKLFTKFAQLPGGKTEEQQLVLREAQRMTGGEPLS